MSAAQTLAHEYVKALRPDAFQRLGTPVFYAETVEQAYIAGVTVALDKMEALFLAQAAGTPPEPNNTVRDEEEI